MCCNIFCVTTIQTSLSRLIKYPAYLPQPLVFLVLLIPISWLYNRHARIIRLSVPVLVIALPNNPVFEILTNEPPHYLLCPSVFLPPIRIQCFVKSATRAAIGGNCCVPNTFMRLFPYATRSATPCARILNIGNSMIFISPLSAFFLFNFSLRRQVLFLPPRHKVGDHKTKVSLTSYFRGTYPTFKFYAVYFKSSVILYFTHKDTIK